MTDWLQANESTQIAFSCLDIISTSKFKKKKFNDNIAAPYCEKTMLQIKTFTFFLYSDILIKIFL